jgi:hypothetical protein
MSQLRPRRLLARLLLLVGVLVLIALPGYAAAQEGDYPPSTTVTTSGCETDPSSSVCGTNVTTPRGGSTTLPFTGGDVALLTVVGLIVVGAGVGLVWIGRRSEATA